MIVAGAISAGVLITTGIVMTSVGKKRSRLNTSAWVMPGSAGLVLGGSF